MESFYLVIVICLIVLAVSDLVVGVSNDAVNFLNSAFGSKVAKRKTILIIATLGILFGAVSSGGMMEIARKGIFNPEMFMFSDIMIIFLAVMITDIILLDLFNTFGMPTSTTVSIMFELLGAAFVVACLKILNAGDSFSTLGNYLNTRNAVLIIAGIFLSVFIAFTIGMFVQYITRMVFSFNLTNTLKKYGAIFGGLAITTISYFLLVKGLKGAGFVSVEMKEWMQNNTVLLLSGIAIFWTTICFVLNRIFNVNVLKIVVLSGTFSLAMAFAGNDLVNFIGVPLAGIQSYEIFEASNASADQLGMGILGEKLQANTLILLLAGIIMILTLWFSKKARSVTETEINLSRQNVGAERFRPNLLSRLIVRNGIKIGKTSSRIISVDMKKKIDRRFARNRSATTSAKEQPAFDLIRASVNLMVASILIAFATSLKLPLSTTYVSFMVAMGTSLADRAWDRDSAVYRVSGVINVISGWLFTAFIAFSAAGILAAAIYFGGMFAVIGLMSLTGFLVIRSQIIHKKRETKKESNTNEVFNREHIKSNEVFKESEQRVAVTMFKVNYILKDIIRGLASEEKKVILKAKNEVAGYRTEYEELEESFYFYLRKIDSDGTEEGHFYLHVLNYLQNISQSIDLIGGQVFKHVNNFHKPMQNEKVEALTELTNLLGSLFIKISDYMGNMSQGRVTIIQDESNNILDQINLLEEEHILHIKHEKSSPKNSILYISILLECRDIIINFKGLVDMYKERNTNPIPVKPRDTDRVLA